MTIIFILDKSNINSWWFLSRNRCESSRHEAKQANVDREIVLRELSIVFCWPMNSFFIQFLIAF